MATERVSAKRYGVRYGRKIREKIGKIDQIRLASKQCPYCNYEQVKRIAAGIWYCNKCESKFTGRAYSIGRKLEDAEKTEQEAKTETPKEEVKAKEEGVIA